MSGGEKEGGEVRAGEEVIIPPPGAGDMLGGLGGGLVLVAYLVWGSSTAARAVAVAALPTALLPPVSARARRYAVYLYTVALGAVFAGLYCCALDPLFLATAAAVVASFAWTLARHARRARLAQPQLRV